jgi:twitching motility two-component system response regulator PilH
VAIHKILIVDDSPTERYYLTDILVKNGFSVTTAENGEEALARIKLDKPELILMDVVMPGANGFQVTRAIARDPALADVPIIICSSKNQETDRIWGLRQGARDYLVKPVDAGALLARIAILGGATPDAVSTGAGTEQ